LQRDLLGALTPCDATRDEASDARPADRVDRDVQLGQRLQHTDAGDATRSAAAEDHADSLPEQEARRLVDVGVAIDADVMMPVDCAHGEPATRPTRVARFRWV